MFEKNLEFISNEALKRRLKKMNTIDSKEGITYYITQSNDYIILKDDIPIDDLYNPREAIVKHFNENIKKEMYANDIIIIFGIGLGYILDEAFNRYPSRIFLYEPDINILHFVLNNADISEHLASGRVYITNDLDELLNKLSETYISKDKVEIVYLQNYAVIKNQELLVLTQKVFDACKSKLVDVNTIAKFSQKWLTNTLQNLANANKNAVCLLSDMEGKFKDQTALIAGAGPGLADDIQKIKSNRNKFVIFAVNKALKYLVSEGIIPDFVVCLDAGCINKTLDISPDLLAKMYCLADVRTDTEIFSMTFKKIFMSMATTDFISQKLAKYNPSVKLYECGGTASSLALTAAVHLGFGQIVFSGIDLAFKDTVIYADGESMNRVSQDEIMVNNVVKNLVKVKSVTGGEVYTREDYQAFITHMATLIKELDAPPVYNLSTFGAYIEGVEPVKFEELNLFSHANTVYAEVAEPYKFKLDEFMQDEFLNINNIITILSTGEFSPALVNAVIKSVLIYQYMQSDILTVLQMKLDTRLADDFINKTKEAIKIVVEILQSNRLI